MIDILEFVENSVEDDQDLRMYLVVMAKRGPDGELTFRMRDNLGSRKTVVDVCDGIKAALLTYYQDD